MGMAPAELERRLVFAEAHAGLFGAAPPVEVGRYIVTGRLGQGGMGVVYRAYDPQLDRRVALKVLHPSDRAEPTRRERLLREARALGRLAHPHVVAVHDVGEAGELVYVAMELVEGPSLDRWLAQHPRTTAEIRRVFAAAGRGLRAVHESGLVHRDFKPSNVIVGDDGRVRVVDFGLAMPTQGESSSSVDSEIGPSPGSGSGSGDGRLTRPGAAVGTPMYMAPEQARGEAPTARSDQYAFCVALHEALFGRHPDPALGDPPSGPQERSSARRIPIGLRRVIERGRSEQPEDRFGDMGPLIHELERSSRARPWVFGSVAVAVATATALADPVPPDPCEDAAAPMAEVWDEGTRAELESRLVSSDAPLSAPLWSRIEQDLGARADAWRAMARSNCEATRVHAEQLESTRALRSACLDGLLDETRALVEAMEAMPSEQLPEAVLATSGLSSTARCAAGPRLNASPITQGPDPEAAREIRYREARLRTQMKLSPDRDGFVASARALVTDAEAVGDAPLVAETRFRLGRALAMAGEYEAAEASQRQAIEEAMEHRHEELEARARAELVRVLLVRADAAAAGHARDEAVAAARRWGEPGLLSLAYRFSGMVQHGARDLEGAQAELERALGVAREHGVGPAEIQALVALGTILMARGEPEAARTHFEEALAGLEREYGPDHPRITAALTNLAAVYRETGEPRRAQQAHERALALLRRALPPDHPEVATSMTNLAGATMDLGELERASSLVVEAIAMLERSLGAEHPDVAWANHLLAEIRTRQGDHAGAAAAWTRVASIGQATLEPSDPELCSAWLELAGAHERAGAAELAREAAERARAAASSGGHEELRARAEAMLERTATPADPPG